MVMDNLTRTHRACKCSIIKITNQTSTNLGIIHKLIYVLWASNFWCCQTDKLQILPFWSRPLIIDSFTTLVMTQLFDPVISKLVQTTHIFHLKDFQPPQSNLLVNWFLWKHNPFFSTSITDPVKDQILNDTLWLTNLQSGYVILIVSFHFLSSIFIIG